MCSLKLWDPTLGALSGLDTLVFAPGSEALPRVAKPNDIIRVHRGYTQTWGEKAQLVLKVGQNAATQTGRQGMYAAFLLFAGEGRAVPVLLAGVLHLYRRRPEDAEILAFHP